MTIKRKIMIVAGEASGDAHAASLVNALVETQPGINFEFFGSSGPKMRAAGVEAIVEADELSVVGVAEIARALPMFLADSRKLKAAALQRQPDIAVLVDFPDFNLRLAKWLKKNGFTVVYYISPQLWAWRKYRISTIRKYVDLLLTILPFEQDWYAKHGVEQVKYVGNPLANEVAATVSKLEFCEGHDLDPNRDIVSLLPGSRHKEIVRILPIMLDAAAKDSESRTLRQFVIAVASGRNLTDVEKILALSNNVPDVLRVVENQTYDALAASDAAVVTSGTATLETGIIGTPMVIVYKTSSLNYVLLRPLIAVEHYGLINLIAGEKVAKELIQEDFSPESVNSEIDRLLDSATNADVRQKLNHAREKLGGGGASKRAAKAIMDLFRSKRS